MLDNRPKNIVKRAWRWAAWAIGAFGLLALCAAGSFYAFRFATQYQSTIGAPIPSVVIEQLPPAVAADPSWQTVANAQTARDLVVAHGFQWIATDGGLVVRDPARDRQVHLTVDHGLPGSRLTGLAVDRHGAIWVAARNRGLVRYDGRLWQGFGTADGLPSLEISRLAADNQGKLWAIAGGRLVRFDGAAWRPIRFSLLDVIPTAVTDLDAGQNGVWVGTADGVWWFDGSDWTHFDLASGLINAQINHLRVGPDGTVWAATPAGVARLAFGRWERISVREGLYDRPVTAIAPQPDGSAWLGYGGAAADEIAFFDPTAGAVSHSPLPQDELISSMTLLEVVGSRLWIGRVGGVTIYDPQSGRFEALALPRPIPSEVSGWAEKSGQLWLSGPEGVFAAAAEGWQQVTALPAGGLAIDEQGTWASGLTPADGVTLINEQGVSQYGCPTAGPDTDLITAGALGPDGRLWFAGDQGAQVFDDGRWHQFGRDWPAGSVPRALVVDPENRVWAALAEGLFRLNSSAGRWENVLPESTFRLAVDPAGLVWFISSNGIGHWVDGRPVYIPYPPVGEPTFGFVANSEGLWLSSRDGVARFDEGGWVVYRPDSGLASVEVMTLAVDKGGRIYAGYASSRLGFSVFEDGRWSTIHNLVDPDAPNDGHPAVVNPRRDDVMAMGVSAGQRVWFGTNFGQVGSVAADQLLHEPDDFRLVWSSVRAIIVDDANSVWFADRDGRVTRVWPAENRWQRYDRRLSTARVQSVVSAAGSLWLGTDLGLVEVIPGEGEASETTCEFIDHRAEFDVGIGFWRPEENQVWWATGNNGVIALDPEARTLDWPVLGLRGRRFFDGAVDQQGRLWFLAADQLFQVRGRSLVPLPLPEELPPDTLNGLAIMPGGQPWLATDQGLWEFNGTTWQPGPMTDRLADPKVQGIFVDSAGSTWFFTAGGISRTTAPVR